MITSTSNNRMKNLIALNQKAKARREKGVFVAEGPKMFLEAPKDWVREVYISESFFAKCSFREALQTVGYEVVSNEIFQKISDTRTPQGILSVIKQPHYEIEDLLCTEKPLLIVLEDLQDPGNLGTIIRTGEGAGINGVLMTRETADIFNPKVIRATMGSIYRVPFYYMEDIGHTIALLHERQIKTYAAHLKDSVCYEEPDYTGGTAFLIGNEGAGLKAETASAASQYIKIPMLGKVESLNAAVATSILMYEAASQRRIER